MDMYFNFLSDDNTFFPALSEYFPVTFWAIHPYVSFASSYHHHFIHLHGGTNSPHCYTENSNDNMNVLYM